MTSTYMSTFRVYCTCIPINVKRCRWKETLAAIRNIIPNRVTTMVYFPRICFFSYLLRWQLNQILITSNMFELTKFGYTNLHTNTRLESQTQQVRYSHMVFEWIYYKNYIFWLLQRTWEIKYYKYEMSTNVVTHLLYNALTFYWYALKSF